ncbi:MAG TPA: AraC family transcriptional regulator ligand-binding domain-containing protein [Polyangiales bacterium]|nr:AraC family transcriptional regulator ligand-binding domain-containing protein [Polyangiales bacterium]
MSPDAWNGGSVAASNAQRVVAFARERGIDIAEPAPFAMASLSRVSSARMHGIWAELAASSGKPELAIALAEHSRLEDLQLLGFALVTAPTFADALRSFVRYSALLNDSGRYELTIERQTLRMRWHAAEAPELGVRLSRETAFAQLVGGVRQLCGDCDPLRVRFRHEAPAHTRAHRSFFGCEVEFAAPFDEVLLPRALADAQPSCANPQLWAYLCAEADQLLCELTPRSLEARVREQIAHALAAQRAPSLREVAASLGTSERTLRRALANQRSFRQLVDDARKQRAATYLERAELSLGAVAYECGFADASAFTHACVRWFGCSPSALRTATSPGAKAGP